MMVPKPSKIEWELTNEPLSKLLELFSGLEVRSGTILLEISWNQTYVFFCGSSCGLASRDVICMMINHYMTVLSIFLVVHIHVFCVAIDYRRKFK